MPRSNWSWSRARRICSRSPGPWRRRGRGPRGGSRSGSGRSGCERPEMTEVDYDERTALIVTDVQNDFADSAGSLYVRGGDGILPFVNAEIGRAIQAGAYVVYTQDWHPESTPHFQKDGGIWPVHGVQGSWGAAFQDGLSLKGEVIRKGTGG